MYEVRQGRARTVGVLLLWFVMPAWLIPLGLWNWPDNRFLFVTGVVFLLVVLVIEAGRIRRAIRREVLFAVDGGGVTLGPDGWNGGRHHEQWTAIDAVVQFEAQIDKGDEFENVWHVGVVRDGHIVAYRRVEGWTYDSRRASAAVHGFGGGVRLVEAPAQWRLPAKRGTPIKLPYSWVVANPGPPRP